jgi:hypothetical protein
LDYEKETTSKGLIFETTTPISNTLAIRTTFPGELPDEYLVVSQIDSSIFEVQFERLHIVASQIASVATFLTSCEEEPTFLGDPVFDPCGY